MNLRSGLGGFVGGINYRIKGFFDYNYSVTSVGVPYPIFDGTIPDITGNVGDSNIITDFSVYFTGAVSYSITPAVEAGWNFDTVTGILTVDTDFGLFGPYIITGTNLSGSDNSNSFNIYITFTSSQTPSGNKRELSVTDQNRSISNSDENKVLSVSNTNRRLK